MSPAKSDGPDSDGNGDDSSLSRRAIRGAAVTVAGQVAKIGIQMLSVVLLARLLSPTDYGLIAMVMAIVGVADIFRDFGLSSAAIQAPTLSRHQQSNLFWVNTALGAVLALLALAVAPGVALLYGQPALAAITMALAVNFLLNGMATQYRADLTRRMRFRQLATVDVVTPALSLVVAIVMALSGAGYWALVAQQVTQVGTMLIFVVVVCRWLPGRYRRDVPIRHFLRFGLRLAGSQVLGYVGNNTDTVALGLTVSPSQLGLYNRSYQLIMTPLGQIRGPLNTVAVPVLSRVQKDEPTFQSYVARGQMAMGYSLIVGLAVVAAASVPLVAILLGPQWSAAAPVLALLALGAAFQTLSYVGYWVYLTKGLVDHLLHYTIFSTVFRVVCVITGAAFGLLGVATAMAVVPILLWPVSFWWLSRRASVPVRQLYLGGLRVILFAGLVGSASAGAVAVAATRELSDWMAISAALAAAAATYLLLGLTVPFFRRDLDSVLALRRHLRRSI